MLDMSKITRVETTGWSSVKDIVRDSDGYIQSFKLTNDLYDVSYDRFYLIGGIIETGGDNHA